MGKRKHNGLVSCGLNGGGPARVEYVREGTCGGLIRDGS